MLVKVFEAEGDEVAVLAGEILVLLSLVCPLSEWPARLALFRSVSFGWGLNEIFLGWGCQTDLLDSPDGEEILEKYVLWLSLIVIITYQYHVTHSLRLIILPGHPPVLSSSCYADSPTECLRCPGLRIQPFEPLSGSHCSLRKWASREF